MGWTRIARRQTLLGYVLILPSMAVFLAFYIYPVIYSLYLSFYNCDMMMPKQFI